MGRKSSLKTKFLKKISLTLAIVFAFVMGVFYIFLHNEFEGAIREKGDALSFNLREKALNNLEMMGGDVYALEGLSLELQQLVGTKYQIDYARILSRDGTILAAHAIDQVGRRLDGTLPEKKRVVSNGDHLEVFTPVTADESVLVQIGFQRTAFRNKILKAIISLAFLGGAALAVLYLFVNYWVRESIEMPLARLARDADRVARGDLTVSFHVADEQQDEIGRLMHVLGGMTEGLRAMVLQVNEITGKLTAEASDLRLQNETMMQALRKQNTALQGSLHNIETIDRNTGEISHRVEELFVVSQESSSSILQMGGSIEEVKDNVSQLSGAVAETSSSIIEISRSISEVANRSQELAGSADSMNNAIQEITKTVTEVEKNAQLSNELANQVSKSAREGLESVEKSGESMGRIKESVQDTAAVVEELGRRSSEIGEIITVINQVTEKTNLLALNAAIIAAAAGEHGASFGVVADGIRDLARQVASRTRDIAGLVKGVQKETQKANERVQLGLSTVDEGEQLSRAAMEKLGQIYEISLRSEEMSQFISTAMAEQNRSSQSLAEASQRVSGISHHIAMATQQEASASNQIQRSVTHMEELAGSVLKTTQEQSEGSTRISEAINRINTSVHAINDIASAHKKESEAVLNAIQNNQSLLAGSDRLVQALNDHVERVNDAVGSLQQAVDRFKV